MAKNIVFCGYPSAFIYKDPDVKSAKQKHLFWGDTIERRPDAATASGFIRVFSRGEEGWMREEDTQAEPLLDIIFVDVGQGDGCLIVTPSDERIIVDAGQEDNMYRYLKWRYNGFKTSQYQDMALFKAAVVSHADSDHYKGFKYIFDQDFVRVEALYHNGLFERKGEGIASLGTIVSEGENKYAADIVTNEKDLNKFFSDRDAWANKDFAELVHQIQATRAIKIRMLSHKDNYLPGFSGKDGLAFRILGPVVEPDAQGRPRLRVFKDVGMTKNGHSIIMLVEYKNIKILLGGDLNIPSESFLIEHYGLKTVRETFRCDVMKSYHHGSGDFAEEFIKAINPLVTVVSSGDNESFSHPRADTLGFIGRWSRGDRPLIFSTELARSAKEIIKHPSVLKKEYNDLLKISCDPEASETQKAKAQKRLEELGDKLIDRSVSVYGAINLRTDGHKLLMVQKREMKDNKGREWDIYQLEAGGRPTDLAYVPPKELRR